MASPAQIRARKLFAQRAKSGAFRKGNRKIKGTSTRTEVRSPTRTATRTEAYTNGNVTVTGGAGRGATNVTIKQLTPKKIGALPVNLTGTFFGVQFSILNQFDVYNKVASQIYATKSGHMLFELNGRKTDVANGVYVMMREIRTNGNAYGTEPQAKRKVETFLKQVNSEVVAYNSGRTARATKSFKAFKPTTHTIQPTKKIKLMPTKKRTVRRKTKRKASSVFYQTGSSNRKIDKMFKAKRPGKRIVKHKRGANTTYYEHRANRSDKNPAKMLGIGRVPMPSVTAKKVKGKGYEIIANGVCVGTRRNKTLAKKAVATIKNRVKKSALANFKRINGI